MYGLMPLKQGRVLCVDDEPNILRSLRWQLQKDFDVEVAASGLDGLGLISKSDFDVVISDQRMPGMMGSDFLREVSRISPRSMPILLTRYSDLQGVLRSVNEGEVFRFVNKPWKLQEFVQLVKEAASIAKTQPAAVLAATPAIDAPPIASVASACDGLLVIDDDPEVSALVGQAIGNAARVSYVTNIAEAAAAFHAQHIGIILSNLRVGGVDTGRMLKLLKQQHPEIVTIVYTDTADSIDVIDLIIQAQIFRFLPKPVKPTTLHITLTAATVKRKQLLHDAAQRRRYAVQSLGEPARESLARDIETVARTTKVRSGDPASFLQRLGSGLMRIFGPS